MGLRQQTVSGIKWQIGVSLFGKAVSFVTTVILARRLGPSVYGLFAFSLVVVSSFELFKSLGIDAALIRTKDDFPKAANTAFLVIPLLGTVMYLLLVTSAPTVAAMLGNREIIPIVRVLGIMFVLTCFTRVPVISLERNLRFVQISIAEIAAIVAYSVTAVTLVLRGFGIWTLVYSYIARTFVYMATVWYFSGWRPAFTFDLKLACSMLRFGIFVFMTSAIWFLKMNIDTLLIGKLLGTLTLGLYAVAYSISNFGADYFGGRIYRVIYPAYAKLQGNVASMRGAFLKVVNYLGLIALPLAAGVFLMGGDLLTLAYGAKWTGAIPLLKVLALLAITNLLPIATDSVLMALGKSSLSFLSAFTQVAMFFLLIAPAAKYFGVMGVMTVIATASLVSMLIQYYWAMRILSVDLRQIARTLSAPFLAAVAMTGAIILMRRGIASHPVPAYVLIGQFVTAVGVYASVLLLRDRALLAELWDIMRGHTTAELPPPRTPPALPTGTSHD